MGRAALQIYRTFLRQANRMARRHVELEVQKPVPDSWGSYGYSEIGLKYQASAMEKLLPPTLRAFPGAEKLDADGLRRVLQANFRANKDVKEADVPRLMSDALSALRVLLEQLYLHRCSSSCTTEDVRIDVASKFTAMEAVQQGRNHNLFTYRVRVTNLRSEDIQILGREWTIQNDRGDVVVRVPHASGNAVVGQQPIIPPGICFEYTSGADLDTPAGLQQGKLEIAILDKHKEPVRFIMANVAPFLLARPDALRD